jgi:hypothetical protein
MHSFRGRGDAHPRLLYWYRTPPDVKVGRAAIDEEAIRALEESNPELAFDWSRILHSHPRPQPADRTPDRPGERRAGGRPPRSREVSRNVAPGATPPAPSQPPDPRVPGTASAKSRRHRPKGVEAPQLPFPEDSRPAEGAPDASGLIEEREAAAEAVPPSPVVAAVPVVEMQASGDAEEMSAAPPEIATHGSALEAIRHEDLARLRARYAEIQARISQRVTDSQRLEKLRALAEQLNPDGWVTADDVASGLAEFEAVHSALRSMLGRRRRRSRRGGVRHRRGGGPAPAGETAAPSPPEVSRREPGSNSDTDNTTRHGDPADEE